MTAKIETLAMTQKGPIIEQRGSDIVITLPCVDAYEATTLFDDLNSRLKAGQAITLRLAGPNE